MPTRTDFTQELEAQIARALQQKRPHIEINAGELHRTVGGYPGSGSRIAVCCGAMRNAMRYRDRFIFEPPSGNGASLTIRYILPRWGTMAPVEPKPAARPPSRRRRKR